MNRNILLRHLEQAEAHVAQGVRHIERQRQIVADLERGGHDAERAREALKLFEDMQALHVANRDRLVGALREEPAPAERRG
jgi:hypothetical protein